MSERFVSVVSAKIVLYKYSSFPFTNHVVEDVQKTRTWKR